MEAAGIEPAFITPSQCASLRLHSQQRTSRSRSAPLPLGAEEVLLGHAALVEEEVRADGGALASSAQTSPGAQARAVSLDDECGEPLAPWARAGAGSDQQQVRHWAVDDLRLGAGQQPGVATPVGAGLDALVMGSCLS